MVFRRPTGTGVGADAGAIKGLAERNLDNLLKIFSKKEATEALTEMAKTKPSTWTDIKDTVSDLKDITLAGGIGTMVGSIKENVDLTIADALSPLSNEVNQLITDWITDNITPILTDITNELANFVSDNSAGGLIGGITGSIASLFLPGGRVWEVLGTIVGSAIEAAIRFFFPDKPGPNEEEQKLIEIALARANENLLSALKESQELSDEAFDDANENLLSALEERQRLIEAALALVNEKLGGGRIITFHQRPDFELLPDGTIIRIREDLQF